MTDSTPAQLDSKRTLKRRLQRYVAYHPNVTAMQLIIHFKLELPADYVIKLVNYGRADRKPWRG